MQAISVSIQASITKLTLFADSIFVLWLLRYSIFTTYLGDTLVPLTKLASIAMLALQVSIPQPVPPGINCNIHPSSLNCFVSHLCPNCNAGLPASIATLTFPASTTACPSSRNCIASHLSLNCYCGPPNLNYSSGPLTSIAMLVLLTSIIEQYPPSRITMLALKASLSALAIKAFPTMLSLSLAQAFSFEQVPTSFLTQCWRPSTF